MKNIAKMREDDLRQIREQKAKKAASIRESLEVPNHQPDFVKKLGQVATILEDDVAAIDAELARR